MAVRLDQESVRDAVDPATFRAAEELLAAGRLGGITALGGGASAFVRNSDQPSYGVWVGVVDRALTAECDCASPGPDDLCPHAVALTLGALEENFPWSSAAVPPSAAPLPAKVRRLAEVATTLPPRQLAMLVAEHASTDRQLATRLLITAGELGEPDETELQEVSRTLRSLASTATSGRWDHAGVLDAGSHMIDELELLALRPPNEGTLRVIEEAARLWDELAGHLHGWWESADADPDEISETIRTLHIEHCAEVAPDPDELSERLIAVITSAPADSCLDSPEEYLAILGRDRVAALAETAR